MSESNLPPLPPIPDNMAIPYGAIRYVAGYTKDYVQGYAQDYAKLAVESERQRHADLLHACEAMSAHYSGSLDHQPPYVSLARAAIARRTPSAAGSHVGNPPDPMGSTSTQGCKAASEPASPA